MKIKFEHEDKRSKLKEDVKLKVPSILTCLDASDSKKVDRIHKNSFCVVTTLLKPSKSDSTKKYIVSFQIIENRKHGKNTP